MGRIRTVKPEFFKDYDLYLAEIEEGMPLRIAFEALWTVADREGRFKWCPQQLKIDCLPYDDVDFSRVLNALTTREFLVKYAENGREFGWIPTFKEHQVINNKERGSTLPEPNENNILTRSKRVVNATSTREVRVTQGKERNKYIGRFQKPTMDEVKIYCQERGKGVDPVAWFNHYEAKGWKIGKTPIKDWRAAVRTWERDETPQQQRDYL